MKNKTITISGALLAMALSGYFFVIYDGSTRAVEVVSLLAIGALAGILFSQFLNTGKSTTKE